MQWYGLKENKISVIHQGINPIFKRIESPLVIEACKRKHGISGSYIFNAGGESPWKNVAKLIRAYAGIVEKNKIKEQLVITGIRNKAILEEHLTEVTKLNLSIE